MSTEYLISFTIEPRKQSWPRIFGDIVSDDLPRSADLKRVRKLIAGQTQETHSLADFKTDDVVILNIVELRTER
jgi:hypothetical protein